MLLRIVVSLNLFDHLLMSKHLVGQDAPDLKFNLTLRRISLPLVDPCRHLIDISHRDYTTHDQRALN